MAELKNAIPNFIVSKTAENKNNQNNTTLTYLVSIKPKNRNEKRISMKPSFTSASKYQKIIHTIKRSIFKTVIKKQTLVP